MDEDLQRKLKDKTSDTTLIRKSLEPYFGFLPLVLITFFIISNCIFGNFYGAIVFFCFMIVFVVTILWFFVYEKKLRVPLSNKLHLMVFLAIIFSIIVLYPFSVNDWWWFTFHGDKKLVVPDSYDSFLFWMGIVAVLGVGTYIITNIFTIPQERIVGHYIVNLLMRGRIVILLGIAIWVRLATIAQFPNPAIDVYDVLMKAPIALLNGLNPYSITYTKILNNIPNYFPYPPGVLLLILPFRFFDLDIRYFFLIIDLLLFIVIFYRFRAYDTQIAELFALIPLYLPWNLFFLHYSWTDSLSIFLLIIMIFIGDKNTKVAQWSRPVVFALLITVKQSNWVILPFWIIYLLKKKRYGELVLLCSVTLIIIVPFFLWSPDDFLFDVWIFHSSQIRYESLTINSFAHNFPWLAPSLSMETFIVVYMIIIMWFAVKDTKWVNYRMIKLQTLPISSNDVFRYGIFMSFLFLLWGNLAFMNHYSVIIMGMWCLYLKISLDQYFASINPAGSACSSTTHLTN